MNSQNRMNAGAEYVLYRIWATLQGREGIHAESLLTCLGALAGYACQAYVRRTGLGDDALDRSLASSPLSVWALVRRAVQKIGAPVPDIESISARLKQPFGTDAFGLPQVADEHRPHRPPIFYLTQLWPQVLPIAQRFCRRPAQLPVLFGIALQRAIEHTTGRLNPTLAASIAMECALAMSKADLPGPLSELFQTPAVAQDITVPKSSAMPLLPVPEIRPTNRKRSGGRARASEPEAAAFRIRMPSMKVAATIMSLAIIAVVSATWKSAPTKVPPVTARVERSLGTLKMATSREEASPFTSPAEETFPTETPAPLPQAQPRVDQSSEETGLPAPAPDQSEGIITDEGQSA